VTYLTTALAADELLVDVRFPSAPAGSGWGFEEFSRRSGDFALAAAAAVVTVVDGRIGRCAIAIAGGGPTPVRASGAEGLLVGGDGGVAALDAAAAAAADACEVDSDIHASADYRRSLIATLTRRALDSATQMARDRHQ